VNIWTSSTEEMPQSFYHRYTEIKHGNFPHTKKLSILFCCSSAMRKKFGDYPSIRRPREEPSLRREVHQTKPQIDRRICVKAKLAEVLNHVFRYRAHVKIEEGPRLRCDLGGFHVSAAELDVGSTSVLRFEYWTTSALRWEDHVNVPRCSGSRPRRLHSLARMAPVEYIYWNCIYI